MPPLLHILIGIWNDIWDKFREFVSEHIEYIAKEEADLRERKESLLQKIATLILARNQWKLTEDGKKLDSSKAKQTKLRKVLKDLRKLNNITGINAALAGSAVSNLLLELDSFLESEVHVGEEDAEVEGDDGEQEETTEIESENVEVNAKVNEIKDKLKGVQKEIDDKEKTYKKFSGAVSKANTMLKKVRDDIATFKASRRRLGDGIETQMYDWMKLLFCVQLPAYHGGKLIGKDCVKMMANAYVMFTHFSDILKRNKKELCV